MATTGNSSNEVFTIENQKIPTYGYRYLKKIDDTGNDAKDYIVLYPETISEQVIYVNKDKNLRTVAQALNYILASDFDTSVSEEKLEFTPAGSLIELFNGDDLSTMIGKLAKSITELKTLLNFIGKTDISTIGDGTVTGVISFLNDQFTDNYGAIESAIDEANRESEE